MTWFLLAAAVAVVVAVVLARRGGPRPIRVTRSEPISTLHVGASRKHSKETRSALDAASSTLR